MRSMHWLKKRQWRRKRSVPSDLAISSIAASGIGRDRGGTAAASVTSDVSVGVLANNSDFYKKLL